MTKEEFLSSVTTEIEEVKKSKKQAEAAIEYYTKSNNLTAEYEEARIAKIKAEKELECLEQIFSLPEILYYKQASIARLEELRRNELEGLRQKKKNICKSIAKDRKIIDQIVAAEKAEFADLSSDNKEMSSKDKEKMSNLLAKSTRRAKSKERFRNILVGKNNEFSLYDRSYNDIYNMPIETYREREIDNISSLEETLAFTENAKEQSASNRIFAYGSKTTKKVQEFANLLVNLKKTYLTEPEPVFCDEDDLEDIGIPESLKKLILDDETIIQKPEYESEKIRKVINPDKAIEVVRDYITKVNKQREKITDVLLELVDVGKGIQEYDNYEKVSNNKPILYGDSNNSEEQNKAIDFFTFQHVDEFDTVTGGLDKNDLCNVRYLFFNYLTPIFFRRKSEIKFKRAAIEGQIKLYKQKRDYLDGILKSLDLLPVFDKLLGEKANDPSYRKEVYDELDALDEVLQNTLEYFRGIKQECECNKSNHADDVSNELELIMLSTLCDDYDINKLLIDATGDELLAQIFEYAAMYKVSCLAYELEREAKRISLREEAEEQDVPVENVGVSKIDILEAKLAQERAKKAKILAQLEEQKAENIKLNNQVKTLSCDFD